MKEAIEAWPLNPLIKEQNDLFSSIADVQVTTLNELDTLLAQGNRREIKKNQGKVYCCSSERHKANQRS